jgi:hypothetical protein
MSKKAAASESTIVVSTLQRKRELFYIIGETPMLCQALSEKAKRELLFPAGKSNTAERAGRLKHDPEREFRDSVHRMRDPNAPTLLATPATAWKNALRNAALDLPGAKKAQIGRLCYVNGEFLPLWGLPKLHMTGVRMADPKRTPDIRTRAIIEKWATIVDISWVAPNITDTTIANLLLNAGFTQGIGDGRPEKGAMSYGQYRLCAADDPEFLAIVAEGGRAPQETFLANPIPYDEQSTELLDWFKQEVEIRGRQSQLTSPSKKSRRKTEAES